MARFTYLLDANLVESYNADSVRRLFHFIAVKNKDACFVRALFSITKTSAAIRELNGVGIVVKNSFHLCSAGLLFRVPGTGRSADARVPQVVVYMHRNYSRGPSQGSGRANFRAIYLPVFA